MTFPKRVFDIFFGCLLLLLLSPLIARVAWRIRQESDGPIFYISERMTSMDRSFGLIKFRTMRTATEDADRGVTGGNKSDRITKVGAELRRRKLDELPQLLNIVMGHMSFVGPRPPLREYVERAPDIYRQVLETRPGVTGLATLIYSQHEYNLLEKCATPEETDHVYVTRCIPAKARLDLIYQRNYNQCFDYWIIIKTLTPRSKR